MVKLLRKYNKYILVVGGSLLMIAFLVPQAFNTLIGDPMKRAYAFVGQEKITHRDYDRLDREFQALEAFNQALTRRALGCESTVQWILMSREAERAGMVAEAGDAMTWTGLLASMENQAIAQVAQFELGEQAREKLASDPELVKKYRERAKRAIEIQRIQAAGSHGLTSAEFDLALAKAHGMYRMVGAFQNAPRFSDRRAIALKRDRYEGVICESIRIPADRVAFAMPEPTEDELKAQFDKYRDVAPATGDNGIGYRLPPRVKLEWLTIDRRAIEGVVAADAVEANKRWLSNRAKYPGEFAAEQSRIEAEIKKERVDKIATDVEVLVRGELKRASARLEADGAYKKVPADWAAQRPKLEDIAQKVVKTVKDTSGVSLPLPAVHVEASKWWTSADLAALPGIGRSLISLGAGQSVPFSGAVFFSRELRQPIDPEIGLQVGLTSGDLVGSDATGARYYFTILDYRRESPPDSLEEVRARVVEDAKRLKGFEWLRQQLPAFEGYAANEGLEAVKALVDTTYPLPPQPAPEPGKAPTGPQDLTIQAREFIPRTQPENDNPTNSPEIRAKALTIAELIDPTKPATDVPADKRTASAAIPRALMVQIVRVIGRQAVTEEMVRATGDRQIDEWQRDQIQALAQSDPNSNPFSLDALKARWKFRLDTSVEKGEKVAPIHMPSPRRN